MKISRQLISTLAVAAALAGGSAASAAQVVLAPSNVIGTSASFSSSFLGDNILDQQTGPVSDLFLGGTYWIHPDLDLGPAFITIDLGTAYQLASFELFNTSNGVANDRGTGNFSIVGGNAVTAFAGGSRLTGSETTLVSGFLTNAVRDSAGNPAPIGQSFSSSVIGTFRYLEFRPTSVNAPGTAASATSYGLSELRVFEGLPPITGAIPEPSTWAMMILGFGAAGVAVRSRRRVAAFS